MNPSQSVHIINVPTSIYPNYNYVATENAFLKQNIEYKDAVICEQQQKIDSLTQANQELQLDAQRWQKFKRMFDAQKGPMNSEQLQHIVDNGQR